MTAFSFSLLDLIENSPLDRHLESFSLLVAGQTTPFHLLVPAAADPITQPPLSTKRWSEFLEQKQGLKGQF